MSRDKQGIFECAASYRRPEYPTVATVRRLLRLLFLDRHTPIGEPDRARKTFRPLLMLRAENNRPP